MNQLESVLDVDIFTFSIRFEICNCYSNLTGAYMRGKLSIKLRKLCGFCWLSLATS